jgi:hypothetical protein
MNVALRPALQFHSDAILRTGAATATPRFLVASMYTSDYRDLAERLRASLHAVGLTSELHETPIIDDSISLRGTRNPAYTKANFIRSMLDRHRIPILYLDCDCVMRDTPRRIESLVADAVDFSIYNWLADEHTDAFVPLAAGPSAEPGAASAPRFFQFSHSIDGFAPEQLLCSGAAQFYAPTEAARGLLVAWADAINAHPGVPDDECLDFAFNLRSSGRRKPHSAWLDKGYARYLFWVYVKPIIDHPQLPFMKARNSIKSVTGAPRWKPQLAELRVGGRLFPRDGLIDSVEKVILRPRQVPGQDGRLELAPVAPLEHELHLADSRWD